MRELLLGAGSNREKRVYFDGRSRKFENVITIDINPDAKPDYLMDLDDLHVIGGRLPFDDNTFDEIHAYEVLEHIGRQGDWRGFFAEFSEYWRVIKPGGTFHCSCPADHSVWTWGDPGHTRVITPETLTFLSQRIYVSDAKSARTDYRHVWRGDFEVIYGKIKDSEFFFVLKAIKPE
jgi:hypothetical protein